MTTNEQTSLIPFFHGVNLWFEDNTKRGGETAESVFLYQLKQYQMPHCDYFNNTKAVLSDSVLKDCIRWAAEMHGCLYLTPPKGEPYIKGRHYVCKTPSKAEQTKGEPVIVQIRQGDVISYAND